MDEILEMVNIRGIKDFNSTLREPEDVLPDPRVPKQNEKVEAETLEGKI